MTNEEVVAEFKQRQDEIDTEFLEICFNNFDDRGPTTCDSAKLLYDAWLNSNANVKKALRQKFGRKKMRILVNIVKSYARQQ